MTTPPSATPAPTTTLSPQDLARLNRAIAALPYSGAMSVCRPVRNLDDILTVLAALRDVQLAACKEQDARDAELGELRHLIRSGGKLLALMTRAAASHD